MTDPLTLTRCRLAAVVAMLTALASLTIVRPAAAVRTYTVTGTCGAWTSQSDFRLTAYTECPRLIVRNVMGNFDTAKGSAARWTFTAPPGTTLEGATFKGGVTGGGSWRSRLYATGAGYIIDMEQCNSASCYAPLYHSYSFTGQTRVVASVTCVKSGGCPNSGSNPRGQIEIVGSSIIVGDPVVPSATIVGGSITPNGWHGGTGAVNLSGSDNTGIAAFDVLVDGDSKYGNDTPMPCDFNRPAPCSDQTNVAVPVDLRGLPDGQHTLAGQSADAAANIGASAPVTVNVDNTPPQAPAAAQRVGGRRWRSSNGFSVIWSNRPDPFAPIGGANYLVCPQDEPLTSQRCVSGTRDGTNLSRIDGIQVPGPGAWKLHLWLYDQAGNSSSVNGVTVGGLGLIAGRVGADGSRRERTTLTAGRRLGRRHRLTQRPRLKLGHPLKIRGRLTAGRGKHRHALRHKRLLVYRRVQIQGAHYKRIGQVLTSKRGRYAFRAGAGPSRMLEFVFPGGGKVQGRVAKVDVRVRAKLRMAVDRRSVGNGDSVALSGRLRGGKIPPAGALLELQVFSRDRWRPFATPRTDASGHYVYNYRFETVTGKARFRFRAVLRKQATYPFTGVSRPVRVRVQGL